MQQQRRGLVSDLQTRAAAWKSRFHSPLGLGVKKGVHFGLISIDRRTLPPPFTSLPAFPTHQLAIITCMDSRVHPERIFGPDIGDAEVIRNAGGHVTVDVLRSWAVCQDLLGCRALVVVHHTDFGGQEAARRRKELSAKLWDRLCGGSASLPFYLRLPLRALGHARWLLPRAIRGWVRKAFGEWMKAEGL